MPQITYYVALPFQKADDGGIVGGEPRECRDGGSAVRLAAMLATDPKNCGAIAFSRKGDPALGDFDDAVVIKRIGETEELAL